MKIFRVKTLKIDTQTEPQINIDQSSSRYKMPALNSPSIHYILTLDSIRIESISPCFPPILTKFDETLL